MCGIAGLVSPRGHEAREAMSQSLLRLLSHRGPDDYGWLLSSRQDFRLGRGVIPASEGDTVLWHRRLSILDLSPAGWQPMGTPDGRHFIVFNGEIYNFLELRAELEVLGHVFQSSSDTEVLLHALFEWGPAALPKLIGMFAFALLDRRDRKLLLARDFFGIKPLYYASTPLGFAFASEIKALVGSMGIPSRVNPRRLYQYLTNGFSDYGDETFFAGIQQLPSAHFMEVDVDSAKVIKTGRYWHIDLNDRLDIPYGEAKERVRELFFQSIKLHLRSDVPVGAALSGGIDSSSIVGAIRHVEPGLELHTFSYIADSPEVSEEKWVDIAADRAGAVRHKVCPGPGDLVEDLEDLIYCQDEPFAGTSMYAQYRVFRLARESGITVMLDGQGADEMLGGYRLYLASRLASLLRQGRWIKAMQFVKSIRRLPETGGLVRVLLQAAGFLVPPGVKFFAKQMIHKSVLPPWLNLRWFEERGIGPSEPRQQPSRDLFRRHLHRTLFETSLPMLLRFEDRNSMAYSIESRVPFLVPALADFLLRLPEDYLIGPDGTSKRIFRDAMRGYVPDQVLDRRDKVGFATPELRWLGDLRPWAEKIFHSDTAQSIAAFNPQGLHAEWEKIVTGKSRFDFRACAPVNLIRWAERFDVSFN